MALDLPATPQSRAESFHTAHSSTSRRTNTAQTTSSAPDSEALSTFMVELGIEPREEDEFAWIAEVGLQTAPPPRWTSRYDAANGATYFIDTDTQTRTWDNPLVPHLKRVIEAGRVYLRSPADSVFEEQKRILWSEHKCELDCWHGPIKDDEGNSYFVSSRDGISSWQDPRICAQYIFDIQCGLLVHLEHILAAEENDDAGCFGGGTPWETEDGAQVLVMEGFPVSRSNPGRKVARISRQMQQPEDHTFMLQSMSSAASWLHDARQNEEEVQRLRLIRKVEERRVRKLSRKLSKAIHETVQDDADENDGGQEFRRIAWGSQGKVGDRIRPLAAACNTASAPC